MLVKDWRWENGNVRNIVRGMGRQRDAIEENHEIT